jgi:hypothetical protein
VETKFAVTKSSGEGGSVRAPDTATLIVVVAELMLEAAIMILITLAPTDLWRVPAIVVTVALFGWIIWNTAAESEKRR